MNVQRFVNMPNALKPLVLLLILLTMLLAASSPGKSPSGGWFFWLNITVQFVFITAVCAMFLYECEAFLTLGRDGGWPIVEMSYSGVCAFCNFVNIFILAAGHKTEVEKGSNTFMVAAFSAFFLTIFYCVGGLMMFRIWRGFIKSGASQNPTPNVRAGDIGGMHPGV
uniref:MARVEL domain-containing protein n=1 Tax=Globodera rostochiensis TaxID=31243 RepID=A0A914HXZ5_GLORO